MFKKKGKILRTCSFYRVAKEPASGNIGYCTHGDETRCEGTIGSCENLEVLKKYLLEKELGWHRIARRNGFKRILQILGRLVNACWS